MPAEATVFHASIFSEYEERATKSRRVEGGSDRQISMQAPVVMSDGVALALAEKRLRKDWLGREEININLPMKYLEASVGDIIRFPDEPDRKWLVEQVETGVSQNLHLSSLENLPDRIFAGGFESGRVSEQIVLGAPTAVLMDLPVLSGAGVNTLFTHIAIHANPWGRNYGVLVSPSDEGFLQRGLISRRSIIGTLLTPLGSASSGRWDYANSLVIALAYGSVQSASELLVLNGANIIAVEAQNGLHELIQFRKAELLSDGTWRLSELLRGQFGTEPEANLGAPSGGRVVVIDDSVTPVALEFAERGIEQNWRIGPTSSPISSSAFAQQTHVNNARNMRMLSPAHLRVQTRQNGDLHFTWLRRGRYDADSWENADIPLDAIELRFQLRILDSLNQTVREIETTVSEFIYTQNDMHADFGTMPETFAIGVAQIADNGLPGYEAVLSIESLIGNSKGV